MKTVRTWLLDVEEEHFICPVCHEYALRDWAGAPTDSKYCPFCGEKLLPWNGDLCYKDGKVLTLGEVFRGES